MSHPQETNPQISLLRIRTRHTQQKAGYPEIANVLVVSESRLEVSPCEVCFSRIRNNKTRENEQNLLHLCVSLMTYQRATYYRAS